MARKKSKKKEFPLLQHIDDLMGKLQQAVPPAFGEFDAEATHDARVATRRLKAALDLLEPVLSKRSRKPLADGLKKLRRRLGPLRDTDVMIGHLAEVGKTNGQAAAAKWLRDRLSKSREKLRDDIRKGPTAAKELKRLADWPVVRAEIEESRDAVESLLAESLHLQADAFAEQADRLSALWSMPAGRKRAATVTERWTTANADSTKETPSTKDADHSVTVAAPAPVNPHDLRIAGKALRYTLEMADVEGHSPGAALLKTFKRMQDQLGEWHDFVVLADRAMQEVIDTQLTHHDAAGGERLLDLAKYAVHQSAKELSGFANLWRQQGSKLAAKIRASFPLSKAVTPSLGESPTSGLESAMHVVEESGPATVDLGDSSAGDVLANEPGDVTEPQTDPDPSGSGSPEAPAAADEEASPAA